jgi:membrane protein YdbS with pleckstrin-like domain
MSFQKREARMSDNSKNTYTLQPEVQHFFIQFVIAGLLIPVLFIGMFLLYYYRNRLQETWYEITDQDITRRFRKQVSTIRLDEVTGVDVSYGRMHQKFGLGNVRIRGNGKEVILEGVAGPESLSEIIRKAVSQIRNQREVNLEPKTDFGHLKTGAAEAMNNLVGLWQQGLISDEDFDREKHRYLREQ